jgi:glycosyl-4,4'-diaponeurosporenoate acyltransferase
MEGRHAGLEKEWCGGPMIHLWGPWAVVLDFGVWLVIHLCASALVARIPVASFDPDSWLYRSRSWEVHGRIYQKALRIKSWKHLLPDGAAVSRSGFRKKRLKNADPGYLRTFTLETCRAELTHWLIMVFAPVFFIWNDWRIGTVMILYGLAANLPCILSQRFNRIRLRSVERFFARSSFASLAN